MTILLAPYTKIECEVASENVETYLARGFELKDKNFEFPVPEKEPEAAVKPDEFSTIAEIRAYAEAMGISLPSKAPKAELLKMLGD